MQTKSWGNRRNTIGIAWPQRWTVRKMAMKVMMAEMVTVMTRVVNVTMMVIVPDRVVEMATTSNVDID